MTDQPRSENGSWMADMPRPGVAATTMPVWVRERRSIHLGWCAAVASLFLMMVLVVLCAVCVREMLSLSAVVWLSATVYLLAVFIGLTVVLSGLGSTRLSRFVRPIQVEGIGRGLSIPGRGDFLLRMMVLVLALMLFLLNAVVRNDRPSPRQAKVELLTFVGAPACLGFFVLGYVIVNRTRISLHPEGIVREIYRRRAWKVTSEMTVLPWDDIADLQLDAHPNPAVPNGQSMAVIRVTRRSAGTDQPEMVIMACEKKVEPNSLLALLRWCRDNPWAREQLGRDEARELLRPPNLLERIRADRAASASAAKVSAQ